MTDIFLSYASADRDRAQTLAQALQRHGYKVWWDRTIPPGRVFDEVIQDALQGARCVVVLWSDESVRSNWVKTEAAEGLAQNKLVPALLDAVPPPIEFKRIQAADLSGWAGDDDYAEYRKLLAAIDERLASPPVSMASVTETVSSAARTVSNRAVPDHSTSDGVRSDRGATADFPASKPTGTPILAIMGVLGVLGLVGAFGVHWLQGKSAQQPASATNPAATGDAGATRPAGTARSGENAASATDKSADNVPATAPASSSSTAPATAATAPPASPSAPADNRVNLLAAENGGELVTAASARWTQTIDGKEDTYAWIDTGEGVFGFKGGHAATFNTFAVLVPDAGDNNLKSFELLWSNEPTSGFKSIGKFTTQNMRIMKNPYQEFSFEPVRAKYLKLRSLGGYGAGGSAAVAYEFRLYGTLDQ